MESTKCGRRARERRALTGEAGNASRRQVDLREALRAAQNGPVRAGRRTSRPNFSRVMRINFGVRMAEIFREHSDSLVLTYMVSQAIVVARYCECRIFRLDLLFRSVSGSPSHQG